MTPTLETIQENIFNRMMQVAHDLKMEPEIRGRAIRILDTNFDQLTMTAPEIAGGACLCLSVHSLQSVAFYPITRIAKRLKVSAKEIYSISYSLLAARGIPFDHHSCEVEELLPHVYNRLVGEL